MISVLAAEKHRLITWVKSATLDDVVVDKLTNTILSIKSLTIQQISCAALKLFCVHHQVQGFKNKPKEVTCLCIIQAVRMKAVHKAMYLHLKDDSDADNDNGISNNYHDVVVLTDKEEGGNHEGNTIAVGENGIISVLQSKRRKKRNSKQTAPVSLTEPETYYRVLNAYIADANRPHAVNFGSNISMAALDSQHFLHRAIFNILLLSYNDTTNNAISGFAFQR